MIRRAEKASVNMNEVKEVRFAGINITKEGMKIIKQPSLTINKPIGENLESNKKSPAKAKVVKSVNK
jgi:hypothetical protein